jgi:L-ribulokinase
MCGVVEDGVVPGFLGYEAGQSAVGDIFAWFTERCVPAEYHGDAAAKGVDVHTVLMEQAAALLPGESGLVALDWWNGNRSVLVDAELRGLLLGMTLATRPAEIYRALIEATAFGTRTIVEAFEAAGVAVSDLVACGGLPFRNPLLMQIYADVLGREISVASSAQTPALGSAIFAAVAAGSAAGGFDTIDEAAARMGGRGATTFVPDAAAHEVYNEIYAEYTRLHDLFGRGANDAMRRLAGISRHARETRLLPS